MKLTALRSVWETVTLLCFPRRCPLCDRVLGCDAVDGLLCPACAAREKELRHLPPRLPLTEHCFYAAAGAASAYYYEEEIRQAILRCKLHGHLWYLRELTDLATLRMFPVQPAERTGLLPVYLGVPHLRPFDCIVPVPPRLGEERKPRIPEYIARRMGRILDLPVYRALRPVRRMQPQKDLDLAGRLENRKKGYVVCDYPAVVGRRILLVDDVITSGATVSACAQALFEGGAADVFAVSLAVEEERPHRLPNNKEIRYEAAGHRH